MLRPNKLVQAIRLALLQERTMETILKELKGSNRSGGSTLNFIRIRIKGFFYFLLRGFQIQRCKRCMKKGFVIIMIRSISLAINVKGSKFLC